jgi:hypothetical protein
MTRSPKEKEAYLKAIQFALNANSDTTNCAMIHELRGGKQCPQNIADARVGCAHQDVDTLFLMFNRLYRLGEINARTYARISKTLNELFEDLGKLDDTASGEALYYDMDEIGPKQKRIISRRDRYRRAFLRITERCLQQVQQEALTPQT